ncbi:MAG: phosphopantothenate/pantothenate synthetase [Nitrososphaerales archaeon]
MRLSRLHPRYESLRIRDKLVKGFKEGIVVEHGLLAHGRGEAFDYLLGERTQDFALEAIKASVASLLLSNYPLISVNGNFAALCSRDIVRLSKLIKAKIEVNLFHRTLEREKKIEALLIKQGAKEVLGVGERAKAKIEGIASKRAKVDPEGILKANTILLALEDGDRTEALRKLGKRIIAIDINPLSRTAKMANITIVDNCVRALPLMVKQAKVMKTFDKGELREILKNFNNEKNLSRALKFISFRLRNLERDSWIA